MDVKFGSGAMLPELDRARELARAIVEVAVGNGLPTVALLTDMNQVLGRTAGNAVEVRESIDHLTGAARDERLLEVTLALCAELLVLGGLYPDVDGHARRPRRRRSRAAPRPSGSPRWSPSWAARPDLIDAPSRHLPSAPVVRADRAVGAGRWSRRSTCARSASRSSPSGGGRAREDDAVDHSVGLTEVAALGERVEPGGRPLALVHARDEDERAGPPRRVRSAFRARGRAPRPSQPR